MNLILCCDGTWNTPDDMDGGQPSPTNVRKIYNAVADKDATGIKQDAYYHPGVGTDGTWWRRAVEGGTGKGLADNIKGAYKWLASTYKSGDQIYLFGFSRGAYTVRSLGGMISKCGLLDIKASKLDEEGTWKAIEAIFTEYRAESEAGAKRKQSGKIHFHNVAPGGTRNASTLIQFIGVWDTVGALGIPDDMGFLNLLDNPENHEFHDTTLGSAVLNARHAVALDEFRQSFMPTLWVKPDGWTGTLKQVWFPGVHGDVGGGYAATGLSDGALLWMMNEAKSCGLVFREGAENQLRPDPRGVLHDSASGIFAKLKTRPRAVPHVTATPSEDLHSSASERHRTPPLSQGRYRHANADLPAEVDVFARDHWNDTGIFLQKGITYTFVAKGEWTDGTVLCNADGPKDGGNFQAGEIAHIASSGLGQLEKAWKWSTGNQQVDFWWTRREEELPWFSLIGVIANDVPPPAQQQTPKNGILKLPHEVFLIRSKAKFTPKGDGYLYCFANDAWGAYGNNRGSVRLTVASSPTSANPPPSH
nr:DUF2235 domain-containing protein [uncultured Rhizobium sp.]